MSQTEAAVRKEVSEQTDDILVSMKGIVKQYHVGGEISTVLKGIDLTVRKGEFLAILGPSGSGEIDTDEYYRLSGCTYGRRISAVRNTNQ